MLSNAAFMEQLNKYYAVWQEYNYVYEEWAKAHGLSVNSLLVLCAVHDGREGCTQKKISQRWLIPKQTVNMVFKDFERRGLVWLSPMPEDKRNKAIRFTKAGNEYADSIISELRKAELSAVEKIGIERMKQLNESMALFVGFFSKAGDRENHGTNP